MSEIKKPMTFDEFRHSHDDVLRRQREHLSDDAVAREVLREGGTRGDWMPWIDNVATA